MNRLAFAGLLTGLSVAPRQARIEAEFPANDGRLVYESVSTGLVSLPGLSRITVTASTSSACPAFGDGRTRRLHIDFEVKVSKKIGFKTSVIRSENDLIMNNSSGGKNFGRQMAKDYREIVDDVPLRASRGPQAEARLPPPRRRAVLPVTHDQVDGVAELVGSTADHHSLR